MPPCLLPPAVFSLHPHQPIRVLLVDTHFTALWGLARLIRGESSWLDLVDMATAPADALSAAEQHPPDIVLLDNSLDAEDTLHLVPQLQAPGDVRVIVLAASVDDTLLGRVRQAGAYGLLNKAVAAEHLLGAIDRVHRTGCWVDLGADGRLPTDRPNPLSPGL